MMVIQISSSAELKDCHQVICGKFRRKYVRFSVECLVFEDSMLSFLYDLLMKYRISLDLFLNTLLVGFDKAESIAIFS